MTTPQILIHRADAAKAQRGRCYYCNVLMRESGPLGVTAEHLLPQSEGGGDGSANIVAACRFCNERRHSRPKPMTPEEYRRHVQTRVSQGRWNVPLRRRAGP